MADKLTPFDFIKSINEGKKGENFLKDCKADQSLEYADPQSRDKAYVPFIVNRGLSYFKDTIIFANEMNIKNDLPAKMQFDFYRNIITPKRRFSKWGKKQKSSGDIEAIQKYYNYSREKAETVYPIFTHKQITQIHKYLNIGGINK
jgi:hypothetical protein